jgi:hypothetical protein
MRVMGLINRKKTNKIFNGSKLVVPGQGISTIKTDKENKNNINNSNNLKK